MKIIYYGFFLTLTLLLIACQDHSVSPPTTGIDWPVYLGTNGTQYTPLEQINKENVHELRVAWEFATGDADPEKSTQMQCNAIVIDGILYATSPKLKTFALNAKTGKKLWVFDPGVEVNFGMNVNRGVTYYGQEGIRRIFFTAGEYLFCLDAKTGKTVQDFGRNGRVSLKTGLGQKAQDLYVVSTSPGVIFKDKIIMGTRVSENADAAPGTVQAFNVRTGALEWVFHTIPQPGEPGFETWPKNAFQNIGGANAWAGMTLDKKRGIVYVPTGSASFDFWGGNRHGENLFANCILALHADTGKPVWHFQTVHHDIWDRDVPSPPALVTVNHQGESREAVAQHTKSGFVFLLDRDTGKPLFPIVERPVPPSDIKGELASTTQPFPVKPPPFTRQQFVAQDITRLSQASHDSVARRLAQLRTGEAFIPPSEQGTVVFPGFDGGGGWGGAAFDPKSGLLYVNAKEIPCVITLEEHQDGYIDEAVDLGQIVYNTRCVMCHGKDMRGDSSGTYPALTELSKRKNRAEILEIIDFGGGFMPGFKHIPEEEKSAVVDFILGTLSEKLEVHESGKETNERISRYNHTGYNRFYDPEGYPAIKPPWGTLSAIDLNQGTIKWQIPLGEYEELTAKGIPKTGTANYGGPVVTAGGLVFIAATVDSYFRAFDKDSGKELWKYKLPFAGYATPSVYEIEGRQFIVLACGGGKAGTESGDRYLAFSLK
ncbi:outer membrane protein assembly factor BamB family protein [Pareuzebyella sediminis]|uniref:outer membrane protein assembly factor BamB family protein n=1 Tax=Pareuzebyella sediminis TaxID=2607998 RepID=UPI0011ED6E9B|nr:PQQ-binding-like beta-propeller repeat protein [Pareuzebyella sediminis]